MKEFKQTESQSKINHNKDLNKGDLITLLGFYLQTLPPRWQSLQTYISTYLTLIISILGVTIAGLGYALFQKYPTILFLEIGPILSFILCIYAQHTISRQDRHVKELIALIAKIEFEIGLYNKVDLQSSVELKPWKDDETFLLPRWVKARLESGGTSDDFINDFKKSSAKLAYYVFTCLKVTSIVIAIIISIAPLFIYP